jgi:GNAT superfamily N-acetyltransferase
MFPSMANLVAVWRLADWRLAENRGAAKPIWRDAVHIKAGEKHDSLAETEEAVAAWRQGQGLGAQLLADAVQLAYAGARSIGPRCRSVVDAITEPAAAFYEANGFVPLPDSLCLVLPMRAIGKLIAP